MQVDLTQIPQLDDMLIIRCHQHKLAIIAKHAHCGDLRVIAIHIFHHTLDQKLAVKNHKRVRKRDNEVFIVILIHKINETVEPQILCLGDNLGFTRRFTLRLFRTVFLFFLSRRGLFRRTVDTVHCVYIWRLGPRRDILLNVIDAFQDLREMHFNAPHTDQAIVGRGNEAIHRRLIHVLNLRTVFVDEFDAIVFVKVDEDNRAVLAAHD
mmetsp:Transcript_13572/g.21337  ORF Transcript_13572/g.21337 Transcript_13572/m.21337 type:complete len:209 (-) Transcript_13572:829-1455(-)